MDGVDIGLLVIRIVVGLLMFGHGAGKLLGWWGGFGLDGTGAALEGWGFRPGRPFAILAGVAEVGAGLSLLVGLLTPLGAAVTIGIMVNTIFSAHAGNGPWYWNEGWEYNLTLVAVGVALAFSGPGAISLDAPLGIGDAGWAWGALAAAVGLVTGWASLGLRRPATPDTDAQPAT